MQENQEFEYKEYKEPNNYILSGILALVGALGGVAIWLVPVYFFDYILFITVIAVGGLAAGGAKTFNPKKGNIILALIAIVATIIAIIIGDLAETTLVAPGFEIRPDEYLEYLNLKFGEDPQQLFYYAGAVAIAGYLGFIKNTN